MACNQPKRQLKAQINIRVRVRDTIKVTVQNFHFLVVSWHAWLLSFRRFLKGIVWLVVVIQFLSGAKLFPLAPDGIRIYPSSFCNFSHSVPPLVSSQSILLLQTNFLCLLFTCFFQVFFGRPRFLLPVTSMIQSNPQNTIVVRTC